MPLLVAGSMALDSVVETPHGKVEECLGGSAIYFSYAAHLFSNVRLVGVVGKDFPQHLKKVIHKKNIDSSGVKELEGKTFRWKGIYKGDMNVVINAGGKSRQGWEKDFAYGTYKYVIIKKGEHGAILMSDKGYFIIPAYPTEHVKDHTSAGDSFAGGMMGYLAKTRDTSLSNLKRAIMYGTVVASFNIEDFSPNRFQQITFEDIENRTKEFEEIVRL